MNFENIATILRRDIWFREETLLEELQRTGQGDSTTARHVEGRLLSMHVLFAAWIDEESDK